MNLPEFHPRETPPLLLPLPRPKTRPAPFYRVIVHNDPVTPMAFVVFILRNTFHLAPAKSVEVMFEAHHKGRALVGVYPFEQAEFLVDRAHSQARAAQWPLNFSLEPET